MKARTNVTEGLVLLAGATGYVGGRLLKRVESLRARVRCLARRPEFLRNRVQPTTEVVAGAVLDPPSLAAALQGVDTAFYLVHAMGSTGSFEEEDRRAAHNFGAAARAAGVRRIIYLGGLGDERAQLSPHLRSRHEVGTILRSSGVQVIEFRASIILGSGSLSFEMIRTLVERLPVMITPRWVNVPAQPIAIDDVLRYLLTALDHPIHESRIYEIGGPDRVTYRDLLKEYARQQGLRRLIIPVPVLTLRLSSLWLGLVTPLYARVGRALIESIRHPTIVRDDAAQREFTVEPVGHREAMAAALRNENQELAETRWNDAASASGISPGGGATAGKCLLDSRMAEVPVSPAAAFAPIRRIGGSTGWYCGNWLWRLRGAIDLLCGGVGIRRGRRDPQSLMVGDTVDWWRVEAFEPDRRLLLRAEMKLPGRAWLEFTVEPAPGGTRLRQTAIYEPVGFLGRVYWYLLYPFHQLIFAGMLRKIADVGRGPSRREPVPPAPSFSRQLTVLLALLVVCFGTAAVGAALTAGPVRDWYPTLRKPAWTPPDWVFGPVWTTLYVLMALAAWSVWRHAGWAASRSALGLFAIQLVLNAAWSGLFFTLRSPASAFAEIILLWCAIVATLRSFGRVSTLAASLLVPYLLWATYAAALNGTIWRMNS
jgi:uncharacterized protein YbjT (DUF2867 family)/tryptophan-rich sensory protein